MRYKKGKKIESLEEFVRYAKTADKVFMNEIIYKELDEFTFWDIKSCINDGELFESIEDKPAEIWLNEYNEDNTLAIYNICGRFFGGDIFNTLGEAKCWSDSGCIGQVKFREVI